MYRYAQLNEEGVVVSVSYLAGEVEADNMLLIADDIDVQPGDIRNPDGSWFRPPPPPPPEPSPSPTEEIQVLRAEMDELYILLADLLFG